MKFDKVIKECTTAADVIGLPGGFKKKKIVKRKIRPIINKI